MNVKQPILHSAFRIPNLNTSDFRPPNSRRGITLLFVISMIVLFLLMGTTFVVVSNDYLRAAKIRNRNGSVNASAISREEGQRLVMQSFYEVIRGPSLDDTGNPLRTHDLLGDMYGYGIESQIEGTPIRYRNVNNTPFIELELSTGAADTTSLLTGMPETLETIPGHYAGQLLTITSGDFDGLTTRVIQHAPPTTGGSHTFIVQPIGGTHDISGDLDAMDGATVIINGKAFIGTGAGNFNEGAAIDEAALSASANNPNRKSDQSRSDLTDDYLARTVGGTSEPNHQSTNEPWDAVDLQNVMLAGIVDENDNGSLDPNEITPSFFRSSLTMAAEVFDALERTDRSAIVVDNDNDGISDGLWIDTGMPVRSTPDGGFIKPLVSFLVLDMDGRLNINAHDCLSDGTLMYADLLGGAASADNFPRGLGFGPAEISLGPVLDNGTTGSLREDLLRIRYGRDVAPGEADTLDDRARYRLVGYPEGVTGRYFGSPLDLYGRTGLGFLRNGGSPLEALMPGFPSYVTAPTAPAVDDQLEDSPYEVNLIGLGSDNDRLFDVTDLERILRPDDRDSILLNDRLLNGDQVDLTLRIDPDDATSTPVFANQNEKFLERLLEDSSTLNANQRDFVRKLLTTHSYEVPAIPEDINQLLYNALTVAPDQKGTLMAQLLSPEVRRGLPMNINRIFGDGNDNNQNGVIDEPGEREEEIVGIGDRDINLDVNNDGTEDSGQSLAGYQARVNFARRLFVLMILLTENPTRDGDINDPKDFFDFDGNGSVEEEDLALHRRMLAQWCVNVVDFRDADSIMTGMEFDLDPFDGWGVNGNLATTGSGPSEMPGDESATLRDFLGTGELDYFVAWGVERPELLITETTAFHDVRTQDLDTETSGSRTDGMPADEDYDSRFVPNASAFFELYNPWRSNIGPETTAAELAEPTRRGVGAGVDLTRTVSGAPVWRLLVFDPDVANQAIRPNPNTLTGTDLRDDPTLEQEVEDAITGDTRAVVRIAYFAQPGLTGSQFNGAKVYYPSADGASGAILGPGQYAVVGSAGIKSGSGAAAEYTTYIGRTTNDAAVVTPMELGSTQQFVLEPGAAASSKFTWHPSGPDNAGGIAYGDVAIALDTNGTGTTRSFGITDPVNGYNTYADTQRIVNGDGFQFVDASLAPLTLGEPVDRTAVEALGGTWSNHPLNHRGLVSGYRMVYLQRLANPLLAYDADTNPYRIVDSCSIDLFVFNGLVDRATETVAGMTPPVDSPHSTDALSTYERTEENSPDPRELKRLWRTSVLGDVDPEASGPAGGHVLDLQFVNTFGNVNSFYADPMINSADTANNPFPWLAWNNRPYANRFELTNVPYTSAYWLTRVFDVRGTGIGDTYSAADHMAFTNEPLSDELKMVVHPNAAAFPHLLNFEADSIDGGGIKSDRLHQVFDFVEVPSRFAGVFEYAADADELKDAPALPLPPVVLSGTALGDFGYRLTAPFDELSNYRYPGKVNLNTVSTSVVWNALLGAKSATTDGPYASKVDFNAWQSTVADCPMRPAVAANYVAASEEVPGSANTGLFRSSDGERGAGDGAGDETDYLLSYHDDMNPFINTNRNAYFRNGIRQRLGGVATNRSSVFAIWVTVGYFEWDPEMNELRNVSSGGIEYGTETGTVQRSRGFFIFDRSIPMAYEPGENHNIERGILLQSLIE